MSGKRKRPKNSSNSNRSTKPKQPLPDPNFIGGEPTAPSKEEWERMTRFQSFVVMDEGGQEFRFPVQAYALVLPEGADPSRSPLLRDYWVGKIKEIRSRNDDPSDVWVSTQWLLSIQDLLKLKSVDPAPFGRMERILSNHVDFVHTSCFSDLAKVVPYIESDSEPPTISDETFYYRYTYDIKTHILQPLPSATCFCGEAYNANESGAMHFCPRSGCCRAFHAECLRKAGFVEKMRRDIRMLQAQRALQFERTYYEPSDEQDEDEQEYGEALVSSVSSSETLVGFPTRTQRGDENSNSPSPNDRHWEIPYELLVLARSPMVKGIGTDQPYEWSCVAGNFAVVTRARRLVREVIEDGKKLQAKWKSMLDIPGIVEDPEDMSADVLKAWIVKDDNLFLCPCCKGAI